MSISLAVTGTMKVKFDRNAMNQLLRGPNGPVARELLVAGEIVKQGARRRVGYSKPDALGRGGRGPHIRDNLYKRLTRGSNGEAQVVVGTDRPYALWHHEGTQAHIITPRKAPMLVFVGRDGRIVRTLRVNHPGTRPNRFLVNALADLKGRY